MQCCLATQAAVVESQGADGRLRVAGGIACPAKRPATELLAMDGKLLGRAGTQRHGWLLAGHL